MTEKSNIKQGTMQELLTGKKNLPDLRGEWEVKKLREVAEVKGGKRLPKGKFLSKTQTPYPYIKVSDMFYGGVSLDNIEYVPEEVFPLIRNYRIYKEDLFISVAGTLGIVGKIPASLDGANLTENADRLTSLRCDKDFLLYVLVSPKIQNNIDAVKTIGAQPKLALTRIKEFEIVFPPLPEQKAIAQALNDVDAAITELDRLITKKRNIKQGAMQQLLTGKRRLAGFSGEWEVKRLGEVVDIDSENLKSDTSPNYSFNYISLEDVEQGKLKKFSHCIFYSAPSRARRIVRKNDILVATVRPNLKSHLFVIFEMKNLICSTGFSVIRCNHSEICAGFIYHHFFANVIEQQFNTLLVGSNYPAVNSRDIKNLKIPFPSLPEQKAIAQVLTDMDTEIEALEQKRNKYKAIKQGMMQELLTGRTRLV